MDILGLVLLAIGVTLIAIRKPLGLRMRARWILHDRARLRMEQIKRIGEIQAAFAKRIEARQGELADWRKERFRLSQVRLGLRNILADAQTGDALVRVLPGAGELFGAKVVNRTAVAAVERGLVPQNLDVSWAAPQAVFVRAPDEDRAREAVAAAYSEALGYEVLSVRRFDTHPLRAVCEERRRLVAAAPEVVGSRAPTGAAP